MPSVSYRKNDSGLLEIWHAETNSYAPVFTPLQLEGGLRVALAAGDGDTVAAILAEARSIAAAIDARAAELRVASERIDSRLALAGTEGRSAADLLLDSANRLGEVRDLTGGVRDVAGQIWSALYDNGETEGAIAKISRVEATLDALAADFAARLGAHQATLDAIAQKLDATIEKLPDYARTNATRGWTRANEAGTVAAGAKTVYFSCVAGTASLFDGGIVLDSTGVNGIADYNLEYPGPGGHGAIAWDASGGTLIIAETR